MEKITSEYDVSALTAMAEIIAKLDDLDKKVWYTFNDERQHYAKAQLAMITALSIRTQGMVSGLKGMEENCCQTEGDGTQYTKQVEGIVGGHTTAVLP